MSAVYYTIREAKLEDAPAISDLVAQLGYTASMEEMADRLTTLLPRPEYITLVAERTGSVVGLVGAHLGCALEFSGPYGRQTGLVMDQKWRGRGIGKLLMTRIESWLRNQGATSLLLTSGKQRTKSHQFYLHLGYAETGLRFMKRP